MVKTTLDSNLGAARPRLFLVATLGVLGSALAISCTSASGEESESAAQESSETEEELGPQGVDFEAGMPDLLSELNLLEWDGSVITYKPNVYPYVMNVPLFTDYALKDRASGSTLVPDPDFRG